MMARQMPANWTAFGTITRKARSWLTINAVYKCGPQRTENLSGFGDFHRVDVPPAWRELAGKDDPFLVGSDVDVRLDAAASRHIIVV